ncbi:MAG: aldolase/citrate lyase family protein [Gemmatimonadota bacterium]
MTRHGAIVALTTLAIGCGAPDKDPMPDTTETPAAAPTLAERLADGQVVFGIFPGEQSGAGGTAMAEISGMDFVFYSLENGPFDLDTYGDYVEAMAAALGPNAPRRPTALRIPPVADDPEGAYERAGQALVAGIDALVVPHVQTSEHAAAAVGATGPNAWPTRPDGEHLNFLIIEDQPGIANVSDIVATPGVSVVFAGPGDLRRAYDGDMVAVENAIQTVLAACKEHDVPCGITAGVDDIGERIEQGFRVFIVTQAEALAVGRSAAGR